MAFFDLFSWETTCPRCGRRGARKSLLGGVKCPNRDCESFDMGLFLKREQAETGSQTSPSAPTQRYYCNPQTGEAISRRLGQAFDPGEYQLVIQYVNFRGEEKAFIGDRRTLRQKRNHVSVRVAPTGTRISLSKDRIRNLAEVEMALRRSFPSTKERRVLTFHARRRSTSPLYERLRVKYPEWSLQHG